MEGVVARRIEVPREAMSGEDAVKVANEGLGEIDGEIALRLVPEVLHHGEEGKAARSIADRLGVAKIRLAIREPLRRHDGKSAMAIGDKAHH
jgi:hypothetical protein